jgi:hypothetical protein
MSFIISWALNSRSNQILPPLIQPIIHEIKDISALNESNSGFHKALINVPPKETAAGYAGNWVDVRDVAVAHSHALSVNEAGGERFLVSAGPFSWQDICALRYILSLQW